MSILIKIVPYVFIGLELVAFILSIIIANTKNKKTQRQAQTAMDFVIKLKEYIIQVEKFENLDGKQKEMFVLAMLKSDAEKLGITEEKVKSMIAEEVAFTKEVNYGGAN